MATLELSDPPCGLFETVVVTAVAVGGAMVLYYAQGLWTPLGMAGQHRGFISTLAYLWMCAVVILAIRRRNWSVVDYLALSRPSLRAIGFGISAQLVLELIRAGLVLFAFYRSCQPITGCPRISFEASVGNVELAAVWFVTLVIIGPVSEEIIFRGFLYTGLVKWIKSPMVTIVITALLFTIMHPDVLRYPGGFTVLWRLGSGLFYGVLRWKFGSLWPSIAAHSISDFIPLVSTSFVVLH